MLLRSEIYNRLLDACRIKKFGYRVGYSVLYLKRRNLKIKKYYSLDFWFDTDYFNKNEKA